MTKKLILFFLFICLFLLVPKEVNLVFADSNTYLRVINSDTPFYSDQEGENFMFYLPYTYYVKVLRQDVDFTYVECYGQGLTPAIDGYVPTSLLYEDGQTVENPYLCLNVTTSTNTILYSDVSLTNSIQYIFADRTMHYYGIADFDKRIFLVEYNGKLGYVSENDVYPFSIIDHPNKLTFLPTEEEPITPSPHPNTQNQEYFSLKFIVIICLLFAGIIGMFIAFKSKSKNNIITNYYDENDYE